MMEYKRLGDIATYINGYPFKPEDRGTTGLPIIRIQDLTGNAYDIGFYDGDYPERIEINEGDVLISWSASLGVYIWNKGKALLNQHIFKVAFDKCSVNKQYFVYAVQHKLQEIGTKTHGATMKHIVKKDFDNTVIPFPTLEEQEEIAQIMDHASGIISARQKELQKLDELVKARFVEMFGEPLSNTKGWRTMLLVEAAPIKSRRGNLADEIWLLNLDAIEAQTGTVLFKHRVQSEEINASTVYFTTENVLYSKLRPYLNKVVMPDEDGVATSEMMPMYPLTDRLHRTYLCYWLRSDAFVKHISEKVAGAKMPRVAMDYFRSLTIELPPLESQQQFAAFVEQVDKSKVAVQKALEETQLLFDSLMQKYFG